MALASTYFVGNLGLRKPVRLNFFNEFRPVHVSKYRIGVTESQRLCDRFLSHHSLMGKFAERVRDIRKKAGLSQMELAKLAGLSQTTISDIERGRNEGSRDLLTLAKALKVSAEWLATGKDNSNHKPLADTEDLIQCWSYLLPGQKNELMERIRQLADYNREAEAKAPPDVVKRTVNVQERRRQMHPNLPFADRRKKHA